MDAQVASGNEVTVPVTFHIPGPLREFTGARSQVVLAQSPATLAEALSALWTIYPGLRDRLTTEQGQIREHVNIFIGVEDVRYTGGLMSPVPKGSEIHVVPAISGGSARSSVPGMVRPTWTANDSRAPRSDTKPQPTAK